MDDGITSVKQACKIIDSKILERLMVKAVCDKNVDGNMIHLCVIGDKFVIVIEGHFKTKEPFIDIIEIIRLQYYFCFYCLALSQNLIFLK